MYIFFAFKVFKFNDIFFIEKEVLLCCFNYNHIISHRNEFIFKKIEIKIRTSTI